MQITFDTPYFPETESGRVFDYVEMAQVADFYVIMAYDMTGPGRAGANCRLNLIEWGKMFNVPCTPEICRVIMIIPE